MRVIVGLVDRHAGSLLHPLITPQTHTQPRMEIEPATETRAQDETLASTRTETEEEEEILDTRPHHETQDTRPHDQTTHHQTPHSHKHLDTHTRTQTERERNGLTARERMQDVPMTHLHTHAYGRDISTDPYGPTHWSKCADCGRY